jgi:hypothetical protein
MKLLTKGSRWDIGPPGSLVWKSEGTKAPMRCVFSALDGNSEITNRCIDCTGPTDRKCAPWGSRAIASLGVGIGANFGGATDEKFDVVVCP